jgi:tripartite-type tricarboxylate transporter receptor subunit TctC
VFPAATLAQPYPSKSIRIVVPFAPGGNTDITARLVAQALTEQMGQSVVVENRAGAGGMIGGEIVAKAPADGYTLMLATNGSTTISPLLYAKPLYDPLREFAPVALVAFSPIVIVAHPGVPAKTAQELIALAKAKPGRLTMSSAGTGTSNHLAGELFQSMTGTKLVHVPYKGSGAALVDLVGGQVDLLFDQITSSIGYIRQGKLRAVAVTTARRATALPDVATVAESGVRGYEANTYAGVVAPAAVPKDILVRLGAEMSKTVNNPVIREKFLGLGAEPQHMNPDEFGKFLRDEHAKWGRVIRTANVKPE